MTGASSSIIRAAIMGLLLLVSSLLGRLYSVTPALIFTASIMIAQSPLIIFYDVGFQLSFLATVGIVYGLPLLESLTPKISSLLGVKTALLVTLSASIITAPLLLYQFQSISLISPLVNLLILPLVPITMLLGAVSLIPFFGVGTGFITTLILKLIIQISKIGSVIPYAQIQFQITIWQMAVMWLLILAIFFLLKRLSPKPTHATIDENPLNNGIV